MDKQQLWEKAAAFHGHVCPGLTIGYRAALYAIVPKKNPLSARNRLTLGDLLDQSFVFLKNSDDSIPEGAYQACLQMGFRPRVSVFVDSNNSKYSAARI